jgi:hypothetical protein
VRLTFLRSLKAQPRIQFAACYVKCLRCYIIGAHRPVLSPGRGRTDCYGALTRRAFVGLSVEIAKRFHHVVEANGLNSPSLRASWHQFVLCVINQSFDAPRIGGCRTRKRPGKKSRAFAFG